jgi:acetylornithine/N-succinyldiaminopimelate aminotransferase
MTVPTSDLQVLQSELEMSVYSRAPLTFVSGSGSTLVDVEGVEYLDFLAGIAVASVGHCHPKVVAAICEQAGKLGHISNLYTHPQQVALAEKLSELTGGWKVFFGNSGAEANECALKLARRFSAERHGQPRSKIVALLGGFHGRTFATLAATGQPHKHERFEPLPEWFTHVAPDDVEGMRAAVDESTAAVMLEIVQGEGGVLPISEEMLLAARQACDEHGALLIIDEVQTGVGRTGKWFAFQQTSITPDIITLAKALGGGMPIGACLASPDAATGFAPGDHASTFGGGPVPCAAALATLDVIESENLLDNATARGEQLAKGLTAIVDPRIANVRGMGLLQGMVLTVPIADAVVERARAQQVILGTAGPNVVRYAPPLIVTEQEVDRVIEVTRTALVEVG